MFCSLLFLVGQDEQQWTVCLGSRRDVCSVFMMAVEIAKASCRHVERNVVCDALMFASLQSGLCGAGHRCLSFCVFHGRITFDLLVVPSCKRVLAQDGVCVFSLLTLRDKEVVEARHSKSESDLCSVSLFEYRATGCATTQSERMRRCMICMFSC